MRRYVTGALLANFALAGPAGFVPRVTFTSSPFRHSQANAHDMILVIAIVLAGSALMGIGIWLVLKKAEKL